MNTYRHSSTTEQSQIRDKPVRLYDRQKTLSHTPNINLPRRANKKLARTAIQRWRTARRASLYRVKVSR